MVPGELDELLAVLDELCAEVLDEDRGELEQFHAKTFA